MKRRIRLLVLTSATAVAVWWVWSAVFGWPPILRTASYFALLAEFARATPISETSLGTQASGWNSQIQVTDRVLATIRGRSHMDIISVTYSDETQPRALYEYTDYSGPVAVRRAGDMLYVHWVETLLRSDDWLLAYDLSSRREVQRRRIDRHDLLQGPG
jgi:hypothetical protein